MTETNSTASPPSAPARPRWPAIVLTLVGLVGLGAPAVIVALAPPVAPVRAVARGPAKVVAKTELPAVEPIELAEIDREDAVAINAAIPFSLGPNPAARPFVMAQRPDDVARSIDCLAAAVLYEAGDDRTGQRAVAQVVLNRLRHPAFPKTVCGVVFQGSERRTGCQFTFTCDGAMTRIPAPAAWARAQGVATSALAGSVYKPVGYATHYHTDWVVPYWSSSLDKIVAVDTHIFFRWTGWWGTPPAFNRRHAGSEPVVAHLAAVSLAHRTTEGVMLADGEAIAELPVIGAPMTGPGGVKILMQQDEAYIIALTGGADSFPALASGLCGARDYCKVFGWTDPSRAATELPLDPPSAATMSFSYLRDASISFDKSFWNCDQFARADVRQCMRARTVARKAGTLDSLRTDKQGATKLVRLPELPAEATRPAPPAPVAKGTAESLPPAEKPVTPAARPAPAATPRPRPA